MTKTTTQLEEKKRKLAVEIKLAKRAAVKARQVEFWDASQALGVRLTQATGARTLEEVIALSEALDTDQVLAHLRQRIAPESAQVLGLDSDADASESGHGYSVQR
jgi:hypothetical protein